MAIWSRRGKASEPLDQRPDGRTTTVRFDEMDRPVVTIDTIALLLFVPFVAQFS